jgi:hypothetical protein
MTEASRARRASAAASGHARAPRRPRLPQPAIRAWAWIAGALAFLSPLSAIASNPMPAGACERTGGSSSSAA